MELTLLTEMGESYVVEIDPEMELENVMALVEAESGIPASEQSIYHNEQELTNPKWTMKQYGVVDSHVVLTLRRKIANVGGRSIEQDAEMMRLQILGDPDLMRQLQETQPELAHAAQNNPARFAELLRQTRDRQLEAEAMQQQEIERLNHDPFDIEAQRKIEEHIRQQAVLENLQHALEFAPESFGRVTMLYIPVEVNSHPVKAFVDSGAQQTIMSQACAEACGIMRLVDKRFAGIARGVGTAQIIGRVHSAQLKLADLFLPCSFTIMETTDVDLLFGLDMLKAHQACIDLEKNVLRIREREVQFLPEHQLPDKIRDSLHLDTGLAPPPPGTSSGPSGSSGSGSSFPGSGQTLGSVPASVPPGGSRPVVGANTRSPLHAQQGPGSRHPEEKIQMLMNLGASREQALALLDAANGNVDVAASLMF